MARSIGIDWIRVSVVFMLFPFHTARVFDGWEPFYVKDTINDFSTWFVGSLGFWMMSLLFVTAGFSACHALQRRSRNEFLLERTRKLLIPLILGLVLIVPVQGYIAQLRLVPHYDNYFAFLSDYFTNFKDLSGYTGGFTPAHLWFILFLFVISLVLMPLMNILLQKTYPAGARSARWILSGFLPMTVADFLPDIGGKNPFLYGLLFLFGFILAQDLKGLVFLKKGFPIVLPIGASLIPLYLYAMSAIEWSDASLAARLGMDVLKNLCAWFMIIGLIGFADKTFQHASGLLLYLNKVSYPVYILHQSVLVVCAYFVVGTGFSPGFKFMGVMILSLLVSVSLVEVYRRICIAIFNQSKKSSASEVVTQT